MKKELTKEIIEKMETDELLLEALLITSKYYNDPKMMILTLLLNEFTKRKK